ncbi:MAG: hypothetical protein E7536_01240 [Ruminococcaceae bacterium]|nr:hypothetical protein [Oscillospiraceae bacterium]
MTKSKKKIITIIAVAVAIIIGLSGFLIFDKINKKSDAATENPNSEALNNNTGFCIPLTIGDTELVWSSNSVTMGKRTYKFNDMGQIIEFKDSDPSGPSDPSFTCIYSDDNLTQKDYPNGMSYFYEYDTNGNLIKYSVKYNDDEIRSVNFEYDSQGRICKETAINKDLTHISSISYLDNNCVKIIEGENFDDPDTITLNYNDDNQLIRLEERDVENTIKIIADIKYDIEGNIETITTEDDESQINQTKFSWGNGTEVQALFVKKNMHVMFSNYPFTLSNESLAITRDYL